MLTSSEIRRQFIDYFVEKRSHTLVPSSPVVPHDDPTLLFANAGMNQFKDVFLSTGERDYRRAVNTQKCIRAGGKHNDLEDVGKDTYHHTFFEMLGNWSFGDYFKEEAIAWAWDLLTNVWGLPKSRLHATVFGGDTAEGLEPDEEAAQLWRTVTDIDPSHIHRCGKKDNFWEMGDTGPCGPCSEIHIDLTPDGTGGDWVNTDDARVIEIWNLVFIQFNRGASGTLSPLPAKHVDTGMGFERLCAVIQGKTSNYDTDVFAPIFEAIREVTDAPAYGALLDHSPGGGGKTDMAYRVIADHIRCLTFALTDGAVPSNEGRGYVLRRILRRAVRHGWQTLGVKDPFLHRLVPAVVAAMGETFPELKEHTQQVANLIKEEEEGFGRTLERGIALFEEAATNAGDRFHDRVRADQNQIVHQFILEERHRLNVGTNYVNTCGIDWRSCPGVDRPMIEAGAAFKLHDTYGFPLDLTQVMAQERGMTVDVEGFHRLMEEAREKARGSAGQQDAKGTLVEAVQQDNPPATDFLGYGQTQDDVETFCLLYKLEGSGYQRVDSAKQGDELAVVVGHTPFYAQAGGQVGDTGTIENKQGGVLRVRDTVKVGPIHFHLGVVEAGGFQEQPPSASDTGLALVLRVDQSRRRKIMANHTGTHLLNRALRDVLGDHVQQKGSLVDHEKLRFDFSHTAPVSPDQLERIEQQVNTDLAADLPVYAVEADQARALKIKSLRAVFGEKYPPRVRVVSIGVPVSDLLTDPGNDRWRGYSIEFCGGTHLDKTGDAELCILISEEAVAKGVRRITALTGQLAHRAAAQGHMLLSRLDGLRGCEPDQLSAGVADLAGEVESTPLPLSAKARLREGIAGLGKMVKDHKKQQSKQNAGAVVEVARKLAEESTGGVIVASLEDADANALRVAMDVIRKKKPDAALMLGGVSGEKVAFVAAVPKPLIEKGLKAGDWIREVAKAAGGGGGGRPDMAQAGGKDPAKLEEALRVGREFAASKL